MITLLLVSVTLILLVILLSMVWPPDSPWSPWWRTSKKIALIMCRLAKISENDLIYDMGSGDGTALITAAKKYGTRGIGVEIDPLRVFISRIAIKLAGVSEQVTIRRSNFFDVNTSPASVVFMYLIPKTLNRLKPKLLKELKPGTRIVTFVYKIDLPMIASDEKNEVYVFEIPKQQKAKN